MLKDIQFCFCECAVICEVETDINSFNPMDTVTR